jgi:hypothetical protein
MDKIWLDEQLFKQYALGNFNNVLRLIDFGADVCAKNQEGITFATLAKDNKSREISEKIKTREQEIDAKAYKDYFNSLFTFSIFGTREKQEQTQNRLNMYYGI